MKFTPKLVMGNTRWSSEGSKVASSTSDTGAKHRIVLDAVQWLYVLGPWSAVVVLVGKCVGAVQIL